MRIWPLIISDWRGIDQPVDTCFVHFDILLQLSGDYVGDALGVAFCYRLYDPWSTVRAWLTMVGVGLHPGYPLSLILEVISRHSRGMEQIMFGGLRISSLLFADDVILFSSLSPAFTGMKVCCWWPVVWNMTTDTNRRRSQRRNPAEVTIVSWLGNASVYFQKTWRRWMRRGRSEHLHLYCCRHILDVYISWDQTVNQSNSAFKELNVKLLICWFCRERRRLQESGWQSRPHTRLCACFHHQDQVDTWSRCCSGVDQTRTFHLLALPR